MDRGSPGLSLRQANECVLQMLPKYEHVFDQAGGNSGMPFDQVYDVVTVEPTDDWLMTHHHVKAVLRELGLGL